MKKLQDYSLAILVGIFITVLAYYLSIQITFPLLDIFPIPSSWRSSYLPSLFDLLMLIFVTCIISFMIAIIGFAINKQLSKKK